MWDFCADQEYADLYLFSQINPKGASNGVAMDGLVALLSCLCLLPRTVWASSDPFYQYYDEHGDPNSIPSFLTALFTTKDAGGPTNQQFLTTKRCGGVNLNEGCSATFSILDSFFNSLSKVAVLRLKRSDQVGCNHCTTLFSDARSAVPCRVAGC